MPKFQIKNRWTGAVQFEAEISLGEDAPYGLRLGAAVKAAIEARANLAGAYLARAYLADANLAGANLAGAYLARANLADAYLAGAYLARANLAGADLGEGRFVVSGGYDRRGYDFMAVTSPDGIVITAGCRRWTDFDEARAHYGDGYSSSGDRAECLARLALMEAQVEARRPVATGEAAA